LKEENIEEKVLQDRMKGGDINFVKKPAPERAMGLVTREKSSIWK
jgi:hypothetical protein